MQEPLLPLFPLEVVLLPGASLSLHIFEDRYKEMVREAIQKKSEFGVVQAGEKGILNVGCSAIVQEVIQEYPDGRFDIIARGQRRFEIVLLDEEKPYLRAAVAFFDDEPDDTPPQNISAMVLAAFKLLLETGQVEEQQLDPRETRLSFQIAQFIPDLELRQLLLGLRSETARLRRLADFLPDYIAQLRRATHVRRVAPTNGHGYIAIGRKPPE